MPIQHIKRVIWGGNLLLLSGVILALFKLFTPSLPLEAMPVRPVKTGKSVAPKRTLYWYESTWSTPVGQISNRRRVTVAGPSKATLLRQLITVKEIISERHALLKVRGRTRIGFVGVEFLVNGRPVKITKILREKGIVIFFFQGESIPIVVAHKKNKRLRPIIRKSALRQPKYQGPLKVGRNHYFLGREQRDQIIANMNRYLREVAPTIQTRNHRAIGLRLSRMPPGAQAAKYGFRRGDVITSVNGTALLAKGQIPALIRAHRNANKITVQVLRQGQFLTYIFNIR